MTDLKVGGVPEHFNYPWYLTLKNKEYTNGNINLRWENFPGGTGEMCKALRTGAVDIAIVLTEGIIKDISEGNPSKIVQVFVDSPLIWGVHVHKNSVFKNIEELEHGTIAISRFGSGSHLMAIVNAFNQGWNVENLKFKVVENLQGGIDALKNGVADYFMWEHFTTKPLVDNGTFRRLGDCPTPWPCFVIAATDNFISTQKGTLAHILEVINLYTDEFKSIPSIDRNLSNAYEQQLEDIKEWLSITEWSQSQMDGKTLSGVQEQLKVLGLIDNQVSKESILY